MVLVAGNVEARGTTSGLRNVRRNRRKFVGVLNVKAMIEYEKKEDRSDEYGSEGSSELELGHS